MRKYANELMGIAKKATGAIDALQEVKKQAERDERSKRITEEARNEIIFNVDRQLHDLKSKFYVEMQEVRSGYKSAAEKWETLDPAKLTDDVTLLNSPIALKEEDYTRLIKKYEDNPTMLRAISNSAQNNKVDIGTAGIPTSAEAKNDTFNSFYEALSYSVSAYPTDSGMRLSVLETQTDLDSLDQQLKV